MYEHVKGCVRINEKHMLLYGGPHRPSSSALFNAIRRAFPDLVSPRGWIWENESATSEEFIGDVAPTLFARAVGIEDMENDWGKFPYVAMSIENGVIKTTPLTAH